MKILQILSVLVLAIAAVPLSAQQLPDAPKPKTDRRIFWTGVSLLAASKTADAITTRRLLDQGGWENSAIFGRHPAPARQAGINAGLFAAEVGVFYLTEHSRQRWIRWTGRTYVALLVANHTNLAVCNSGIDPHAAVAHNCYSLPIY